MIKTFCDVCNAQIVSPILRGYKMNLSNWDHTAPYVEGVIQEPCIANLELCKRCAQNLYIHIDNLMRRYRVSKKETLLDTSENLTCKDGEN